MPHGPSNKERARHRLEKSLAAVATFARIREELLLMRMVAPLGPKRDRIEQMISLNQETLKALSRSVTIAKAALTPENAG